MKAIILILLVLVCANTKAQNIVAAEYFIDLDKGIGKNTAIAIDPGKQSDNISLSFIANLSNETTGMHHLYIRTKDASNHWSIKSSQVIMVSNAESTKTITNAEYFIDNDPGIGSGIPISISPKSENVSMVITPDLSQLSTGLHTFYARAKCSDKNWSLLSSQLFYIIELKENVLIESFSYYFTGDGFTSAEYIFNNFTPAETVNLSASDFLANVSELEYNNEYTLHIRALNSNGKYSEDNTLSLTFKHISTSVEAKETIDLIIYPNPVQEQLHILNLPQNETITYTIYSSEGKKVSSDKLNSNCINISNLNSGKYYLFLINGTTLYKSETIIKE